VRRSRTLNVLCDLIRARSRSRPTVMVVEDMHWSDPSTIDLLSRLLERSGDVPLLLLFTCRPDFTPPWVNMPHVHALTLEPLTSSECAELFDALVGARSVPSAVRDELLARGDGIPLFVEELTRAFVDSADHVTDVLSSIPDTLQGLLLSRLDRLSPPVLETLHLASALGREFRFDVLASVSDKTVEALREDLSEVVGSGLVHRRELPTSETYLFKHALVADAAYASILRADRRRLHGRIAHRLREAVPAIPTGQPELLAHHFGEAGEPETAVDYWRQAGDGAIARGAYQEAVRHFDRGLELIPHIGDDRVQLRLEIELTESRGTALFSMLGYAHPQVESTFARASSLCERSGSSPPLRVLYGLWAVHLTRGDRDALELLLPRFDDLARSRDPVALLTAHANAGVYAYFLGDFETCLAEMTEATRWYSTSEHSTFLRRHGYGGGLYPFAYRMSSLMILGRPDQAAAAGRELQMLAEQAGNPYGLAIAGGFRMKLARDARDPKETFALADGQVEYTRRQMLPFWEGSAHCLRGWARALLGEAADGIAEIELGLRYLDAVGLCVTYPSQLGGLAEALTIAGDHEAALAAARRGLALCETKLDRCYEAELLRLEAEALWKLGDVASAESGLTRALALARRQSATLYALRAAASLARLLIEQGRGELARHELESVLVGITEGLDTSDIVQVRELLGALA
jgi:tetratricopeptide (TPR) repeat protein